MRVTTNMIYDRTTFNLSRNIERFMQVESMVSSGRRINTPSDDPVGTHHDLKYRARLSEIEQYLSNISQGTGGLATYESGLGDLKDLYSTAKEIALMMANDTYDEVAREAAAKEVESLFQQVMKLANDDVEGRYLYAGHKTRTKPMEAFANGIVYRGDGGMIDLEVDTSSRITSNLIGQDVFLKQLSTLGEKADLHAGLTGATLVTDLNLGAGIDLSVGTFEVYDANRNSTYTIDVSGAITVDDVINAINTQLGAGANLSVRLADTGAALQWEPVSGGINSITVDTPLSNLNGGTGVDQEHGKFEIHNGDSSISVQVNISGAAHMGDVITAINDALTAAGVTGVTAGLNADGNGLGLSDANIPPLGLMIDEISMESTTAADLGILGGINPALEGADLNPKAEFVIRDIGAQTTAKDLGIARTVTASAVGDSIRPRLTLTTTLASLSNGSGFGLGEIRISQGDRVAVIDLGNSTLTTVEDALDAINSCGLEITASINAAGTGIQIESTAGDRTLIIENNDGSKSADALGVRGSSDMLGSLMLLVTALHDNDRELAEQLVGNLDLAMNKLLNARADIGSRMIRMQTTQNRLEGSRLTVTRLLSDVEDADMTAVVSELARQENLYQAALMASSKIMQQSLVDLLR